MSYGTKSSTSSDSNSVSNDFVSCDNNDKSSEANTNNFASSDSSVKSSEPKSNDSTSCASTSSVSTSESEAEIESNVGTPIQEPIIVGHFRKNKSSTSKSCFVCGSYLHLIKDCNYYETQYANDFDGVGSGKVSIPAPAGRPTPFSTGRTKPVSTGKQNRHPPVHAGRRNSSSVTSGWWHSTARPMT
ncbi:hypothetical protein Tco_1366255, partial [Tanacetum coccineum]